MSVLNFIRSLFLNSAKSLENRSNSVMSVFSKTVDDLNKINTEVLESKVKKIEAISKITKEVDTLEAIHISNSKIINKIDKFFN